MTNWKQMKSLPVYISVAALLSACGASSTTFQNSAGNGTATNNNGVNGVNPIPNPSPTSTISNLASALSFSNISVTGQGGTNPTYSTYSANGAYIQTDNELKVRLLVEPGSSLLSSGIPGLYSNFSTNYNCVSYQVSIYDDSGTMIGSQSTSLLAVPGSGGCINNPSTNYQDLDFSGSVSNPHGGINVEVTALEYDFYCKYYANLYGGIAAFQFYNPQYFTLMCPAKSVYRTHTVDFSIQVETNGTQLTVTN